MHVEHTGESIMTGKQEMCLPGKFVWQQICYPKYKGYVYMYMCDLYAIMDWLPARTNIC